MSIAPGEKALAVIGMSNIIDDTVSKVGVGKLEEINSLDAQVVKLAKQLVDNELPEPEMPRKHNYRALLDRLSKGLPPHEIEKLTHLFPESESDMAGQFLISVQGAWEQLKSIFPTSDYNTFAGPTTLVPDTEAVWTFFLELAVINDPLSVFPLIGAGALLDPQVKVIREFFPTFSKAVDDAIYAASAQARAAKSSYRLPPRAEYGNATWFGRRIAEFGEVQPITPPTPGKNPTVVKLPKTLETQGQMASNPSA